MEQFDLEVAQMQGLFTAIHLAGNHLRDDIRRAQALESDLTSRTEGDSAGYRPGTCPDER